MIEENVMTEPVTGALLTTVLILAVYLDIRTARIPNWLTFTGMGSGFLAHLLINGTEGAIFSFLGLGTGLVLFLTFYLLGDMGAGDVKLMGAVGAMVGPYGAFVTGILAVMAGGIYALTAMSCEWGAGVTARRLASGAYATFFSKDTACGDDLKLPYHLRYGVAIASGALLFRFGLHPFGG
jgi:prepilin peptidase CpaA